ncbi:hypothetical protein KPK_A0050 (plasmid) [Klebsiella variicola]|uniref:Uncharacterized protein n=1 Tax=Klebsiella variicola (strain 342) TaxID=507522 RepID=B5RJX6_KLEV3|nr:hypothetical protein KPK_A0050 [Klebsiella variicola]
MTQWSRIPDAFFNSISLKRKNSEHTNHSYLNAFFKAASTKNRLIKCAMDRISDGIQLG